MDITAGLIHALTPCERRVLSRAEAASYVGVSPGHFSKLVENGAMPTPLEAYGRARRWDKAALDHALDSTSGVNGSAAVALGAYDLWRSAHGEG